MIKSLIIGVIVLIFLVSGGLLLFNSSKNQTEILPLSNVSPQPSAQQVNEQVDEQVDYQASFAIFTNGTFRIFSAAMYHNLSDDVFIQADNPNIVHVKKRGVTWNDFFKTLPFKLTKTCLTTGTGQTFCTGQNGSLKFYLNGVIDNGLLDKTIISGDQALISFGNEDDTQIQKQIQRVPKAE